MRVETCVFDRHSEGPYRRLAAVLARTARQHCPTADVHLAELSSDHALTSGHAKRSHLANVHKVLHWVNCIQNAADGEQLLLIDADCVILRPLDDVWQLEFDLAYTVRPQNAVLPLNSGVMFVRVSTAVRTFAARWAEMNLRMLADAAFHDTWRQRYGGINQAAFGALLDAADHGLHLRELPCQEWNCEDLTWADADAATRILHIKGALRAHIFGLSSEIPAPHVARLAELWRRIEQGGADDAATTVLRGSRKAADSLLRDASPAPSPAGDGPSQRHDDLERRPRSRERVRRGLRRTRGVSGATNDGPVGA